MGNSCGCGEGADRSQEEVQILKQLADLPVESGDGLQLTIVTELTNVLQEHPYLRPTSGESSRHPLLYWVRRCTACLKEGNTSEAGACMQRITTVLRSEKAQMNDAFRRFDADDSGKLDSTEFKYLCAYLGWGVEEAAMMDLDGDQSVTMKEFELFVERMGGMQRLFERRRQRVAARQQGTNARAAIEVGARVRSYFYAEDGRKSPSWKEAQVLATRVQGCPDAPGEGVLLTFSYGEDAGKPMRQTVPPAWVFCDQKDSAVIAALRESGILEEQQGFWASVFPESEMRAVERLVPCQRSALANVRQSATDLHLEAMSTVRDRFTELGYGEHDLQCTLHWIQELAPMVVHVHIDKMGRFMETDEFYRNQFETKTSCGALDDNNDTRRGWEKELFGDAYDDAKPFERCKYGALNVTNDYRGVTSAYQYGDSYLVLKDVRLRCSFAATDSGGLAGSRLAVLDKYAHVLQEYNDDELKHLVDVATAASHPGRSLPAVKPTLLRGSTTDPTRDWITLGFPDLAQGRGRYYFEVELFEGTASPQVGVVSSKFVLKPEVECALGVGDDEHGWCVDGQHAAVWHGGKNFAWGKCWPSTDIHRGYETIKALSDKVVVVGIAVDLDERKIWFASNGEWDESPSFTADQLPEGVSVYPAMSLMGRGSFTFGSTFKYGPPANAGKSFVNWPFAPDGVIRVDCPMIGNSDVLSVYKEIQIHGEVSLKRNVQRLVANRKYLEMPKHKRTMAVSVSGAGSFSGTFDRSAARGGMPMYKNAGGACIYWEPEAKRWILAESEDSKERLASAPGTPDESCPPRSGWEVPFEKRGVIAVDAFTAALEQGGVSGADVKKLVAALTAPDSQGHRVIFRESASASLEAEWAKLSGPPMGAKDAWALAVTREQQRLLEHVGLPRNAVVVESEHPYKAQSHSWSRDVAIKGAKDLSVFFSSKCCTFDSCAVLGIKAGISKATGVGARVQFRTLGPEYMAEQMRGTVVEQKCGGLMKVSIDEDDLTESSVYQEMNPGGDEEGEGEHKKDDKEMEPFFVLCAAEQKIAKVKYAKGTKVGDEISGFAVDRSFVTSPFTVGGFSSPGPAMEEGVQSGWFLDLSATFEACPKIEEAFDQEPPEDDAQGIDARIAHVQKQLEGVLAMTDVTLVFVNGLKASLLPSAQVQYGSDQKVGDEIASFDVEDGDLTISEFKDEGPAQEAGVQEGWRVNLSKVMHQGRAKKKTVTQSLLNLGQALHKNKAEAEDLSEEKILENPELLLNMSGITLFFEPASLDSPPIFQGYGGEESGMWETCKIPSDCASFTFGTDGDGVDYVDRRWGVFAVVLPGDAEPSQETIDNCADQWVQVTERATGFGDSLTLEPEDWDEARLRALCARHGWEFEWMTEDGERHRRIQIGEALAREQGAGAGGGQKGGEPWWSKVWSRSGVATQRSERVLQDGEDAAVKDVKVDTVQLAKNR